MIKGLIEDMYIYFICTIIGAPQKQQQLDRKQYPLGSNLEYSPSLFLIEKRGVYDNNRFTMFHSLTLYEYVLF